LRYKGYFNRDHIWLAADNAPLVTFRFRSGFMLWSEPGTWGEVEAHPPAAVPELDLLIALGWYLKIAPPGPASVP
jgi:hypothetical protein